MLPTHHLTRHAVCVGQTGSGKTGLCVALLEDLAAAGTPILALDPKGDLANLALVFPELDAASFRPWIDPAEATRRGVDLDTLAATTADGWRRGLAASGLGSDDLRAWKDRVEVIVMTPGSDAGAPVDVLSALTRCPAGLAGDVEGLRAYVTGAVSALLGLVEHNADPLNDPATILVSRLLEDAFAAGRDLPLDALLGQIVSPPFDRLGYFPLDDVLSPKARQALALKLNNVVAAPAFAAWRTGVALDLDAWTAPIAGRTPIRVLYLAHLTDAERMFFVTLLLHAVVAWTRRLPGTGDLRALVYFDEVWGYLPPHPKDPPSKAPLLTLLKQARAVGVGVMLATQNPVDLDYKALSNAGTWMVGRLLTENDRARVLEGLVTSAPGADRATLDRTVAGLAPRGFVVRTSDGKVGTITSRHTRAWLRGPLTRREVQALLPARTAGDREPAPTGMTGPAPVPVGVPVRWLRLDALSSEERSLIAPTGPGPTFRPVLYARFDVRFDEADWIEDHVLHRLWAPLVLDRAPLAVAVPDHALADAPPHDGDYALLPPWIDQVAEVELLRDAVIDSLVRTQRARRVRDPVSGAASLPGEDAEAFAARVGLPGTAGLVTVDVPVERSDVRVRWVGILWVGGG